MRYYAANDGQYLFNLQLRWLGKALVFLFRCLVYAPLVFTGYWLASGFLAPRADGLWWVLSIATLSYLLYAIVYFLKGILVALKAAGRWTWVLLWVLLVAYTCILPVWLVFTPVANYVHNPVLAWLISLSLGFYVYSRYLFLTNIAPAAVFPLYQSGISLVSSSCHLARNIKGGRSSSFRFNSVALRKHPKYNLTQ